MRFIDSLKVATAVYPDANIELEDRGLVIKPSAPPVAPRLIAVNGAIARVQGLKALHPLAQAPLITRVQ
jgi:hypothetical protein